MFFSLLHKIKEEPAKNLKRIVVDPFKVSKGKQKLNGGNIMSSACNRKVIISK